MKKFLLCLNTEVPLFPRIFSASHIHEQGRTDALAVSCSSNNSWFNHEARSLQGSPTKKFQNSIRGRN